MGVLAAFLVFGHCHFFSCSLKEKRAAVGEVKVFSHVLSLEGMCCHNCASLFKLLAGNIDGSQWCLLHPSHAGAETGLYLSQSWLYQISLLLSASGANGDVLSWESSILLLLSSCKNPATSGTGEVAATDDCALKCNLSAQIVGQDFSSVGLLDPWEHY